MKIAELRGILKDYTEEELRLLAADLYKAIPKSVREAREIDDIIMNVRESRQNKNAGKAEKKRVTAGELRPEIELFLENAYAQNYFAPNRVVPKKERPKWRFKVKNYIKSLQEIPSEGEEGKNAAELLEKLYAMLCYGCCYYIFNTEDPFRSVGIEQEELFDMVIKKTFGNGTNRETIRRMICLAVGRGVSAETLHSNLLAVLEGNLKTPDSREIAIEEAKKETMELNRGIGNSSKKKGYQYGSSYELEEKRNNLTELVFRLNMDLCEYEEGIRYYKMNIRERNGEIGLYCLLQLLFMYGFKDLWVAEYEAAVKKKIKPRENLQKIYQYIMEHDELPEHFW